MNVSNKITLAALRLAYAECTSENPATSLRANLISKSSDAFSAVSAGSIRSTSANGQHVTFASQDEGINAGNMVEMWSYILELFDRAKAELGGTPADEAIEAKMETYLRDVTGYQDDWRYLEL